MKIIFQDNSNYLKRVDASGKAFFAEAEVRVWREGDNEGSRR